MGYRKIDAEPEFGEPLKDLRPRADRQPSRYWALVVEHAKDNPGQWIPLVNSPVSMDRLRNIAQQMRNHPGERRVPVPLRVPGMQTRINNKQFWFRYDEPVPDAVAQLRQNLAHISGRRFA